MRKYDVLIESGFSQSLNTYCVTVMEPGNRKSAMFRALMAPIDQFERELRQSASETIKTAESQHQTWKKKIDDLRGRAGKSKNHADFTKLQQEIESLESQSPVVPPLPQLTADDATPESICSLLAGNDERLTLSSASPVGYRECVSRPVPQSVARRYDDCLRRLLSVPVVKDEFDRPNPRLIRMGEIGEKLHAKLVNAGLVEKRIPKEPEPEPELKPGVELGAFLAEYRDDGLKASGERAAELTVIKWRAPMDSLLKFFGYERDMTTITHDDAHQFRKWMDERRIKKTKANPKGQPLAENTKRKHMDNAKVFFNGAKRRGLIPLNPFEYQVSSTRPNRERDFFLTREDTDRIIEVCRDAEWKLLVSHWRYAGLRKMEVFQLTWGDVLWDQGKMRVTIPKTKHHEGKDIRDVPLRDIRQYLQDAFQAALPDGAVSLPADCPIITRFSDTNSNLDKPFKSILHRAGLVPWPKLFQNMRASCETEWLNEGHPAHVVAAWIGHSVKVQRDSYAQITDGHYESFNAHPGLTPKSGPPGGPEPT